jgi:hypothetical protein
VQYGNDQGSKTSERNDPIYGHRAPEARQEEFSLTGLIRWYIDSFFEISGWQRTKQTSLDFFGGPHDGRGQRPSPDHRDVD